jgi:hypothetical protein
MIQPSITGYCLGSNTYTMNNGNHVRQSTSGTYNLNYDAENHWCRSVQPLPTQSELEPTPTPDLPPNHSATPGGTHHLLKPQKHTTTNVSPTLYAQTETLYRNAKVIAMWSVLYDQCHGHPGCHHHAMWLSGQTRLHLPPIPYRTGDDQRIKTPIIRNSIYPRTAPHRVANHHPNQVFIVP